MSVFQRIDPCEVGWQMGTSKWPRGAGDLWVRWERTTGVIGPQGSGKTLDCLIPALLQAPGAALVTLTKPQDMLLSWAARSQRGPCVVLDPFGLTRGMPELVFDPIEGCVDPQVAERRAKAWTAGTIKGGAQSGQSDDAARFYANEAAKVLQCYLHAAALTGADLDEVLEWVANPLGTSRPTDILRNHEYAAPHWAGLLEGALRGDPRAAGNTTATVHQALSLFFQEKIRRRCVPGPGRPATDIAQLIEQGGTVYLLGREDPYASASPLMTAVAEHVLDTALELATASPWGRLCPPILASRSVNSATREPEASVNAYACRSLTMRAIDANGSVGSIPMCATTPSSTAGGTAGGTAGNPPPSAPTPASSGHWYSCRPSGALILRCQPASGPPVRRRSAAAERPIA